nr:hypothetical protein [Actinomycetota bacterium]
MAWKESGRLESVREAWAEVRPVAGTPLLSEYGKLGVDAAIDWLRSGSWPDPKASEEYLDSLADRLRDFRQWLDEGLS